MNIQNNNLLNQQQFQPTQPQVQPTPTVPSNTNITAVDFSKLNEEKIKIELEIKNLTAELENNKQNLIKDINALSSKQNLSADDNELLTLMKNVLGLLPTEQSQLPSQEQIQEYTTIIEQKKSQLQLLIQEEYAKAQQLLS